MKKARKEELAYRRLLRLFEEDEPHDGNDIQTAYVGFLNALLRANKKAGKSIFYMPQLGQREAGVGVEYVWVPWGLVTKGIDKDENLSPVAVRDACSLLTKYPLDYPWIRHAFDIEGWKLGMLYAQGLAEQARIWQSLSELSNNQDMSASDANAITKEDARHVLLDAASLENYLKAAAPFNVRPFYKATYSVASNVHVTQKV
jgi:hypothetical protein